MHISTFEQHIKENSPCWDGYQQVGLKMKNGKQVPNCVPVKKIEEDLENTETIQEFSKNRLTGATKIAMSAKEKGGDALLTYHHFKVKLPYYEKAAKGKLAMEKLKKEYDNLLTDLYESTRNSMNIAPIKFQELVGKIEVVGELLIRMKA
jgi:SPX domain protein involved in polyphosphate accumulation